MTLVLTVIAALFAVAVAAVLLVPVDVQVSATKSVDDPSPSVDVQIRWFGLALPRIRRSAVKPRAPRPARRRHFLNRRAIIAALKSPGFLPRCSQLVADCLRTLKPRRFELDARIGFDDPADTGALLGWLYARRSPDEAAAWRIHVEPDFQDEVLEGRLHVRWSRSIGALLWPAMKFLASPTVWRAMRASLRA